LAEGFGREYRLARLFSDPPAMTALRHLLLLYRQMCRLLKVALE
jgi:hypothetical protein